MTGKDPEFSIHKKMSGKDPEFSIHKRMSGKDPQITQYQTLVWTFGKYAAEV